jgi:hypothetical protein
MQLCMWEIKVLFLRVEMDVFFLIWGVIFQAIGYKPITFQVPLELYLEE